MGSKNTASVALFFALNILLFSLVSSCDTCPGPKSKAEKTPTLYSYSYTPGPSPGKCPRDAMKLGVCADILKIINNIVIGFPPTLPCCSLLGGLLDLEAAMCLCITIRANVMGLKLNLPMAMSMVLNNCGKKVPNGFECT